MVTLRISTLLTVAMVADPMALAYRGRSVSFSSLERSAT